MALTIDKVREKGRVVASTGANGLSVSLVAMRDETELCALVQTHEGGFRDGQRTAVYPTMVFQRLEGEWRLDREGMDIFWGSDRKVPENRIQDVVAWVRYHLENLESRAELFSSRAYGIRKALGEQGVRSLLYNTDLGVVRVSAASEPGLLVVERTALSDLPGSTEDQFRHDGAIKFVATVSAADLGLVDFQAWRHTPGIGKRGRTDFRDPRQYRELEALVVELARKAALTIAPEPLGLHEFEERMHSILASAQGADTSDQVEALRGNADALLKGMFDGLADRVRERVADCPDSAPRR